MTKKEKPITMYKNNSRDSRKFKGCSPLRLFCNLTRKCHAVGYYSYTHRWQSYFMSEHRLITEVQVKKIIISGYFRLKHCCNYDLINQ